MLGKPKNRTERFGKEISLEEVSYQQISTSLSGEPWVIHTLSRGEVN